MQTDYSGTLTSHKMINELITRSSLINNSIVLTKGAFFKDGLVLSNATTNVPLTPGQDYSCKVLDAAATGHTGGKEVYTLISLNVVLGSDLRATYQYVGGVHVEQRATIINLLNALGESNLNDIYFSQLKNKPSVFPVTEEHLHDASQVTGKDEEIAALVSIKTSIEQLSANLTLGPDSEIYTRVTKIIDDMLITLTETTGDINERLAVIDTSMDAMDDNNLTQSKVIVNTQTRIINALSRLMLVEITTNDYNDKVDSMESAYGMTMATQTLNTIKNQILTISLSHSVMRMGEKIRLLESE